MATIKIARQAYRRTRQADLAAWTENIVTRMQDAEPYVTLQPLVQTLRTAAEHYLETLAAARNRGRSEVLAKNLAQQAVFRQLDLLATALEALAVDDAQLVVDAGFTLQLPTTHRYAGKIATPLIQRAFSTGRKGEIRLIIDDQMPKAVRMHAVEYSLDRGAAWQNGAYNSRRNFVVPGLPHGPELWVHVKSLGYGDKRSEWSEPVRVAVL